MKAKELSKLKQVELIQDFMDKIEDFVKRFEEKNDVRVVYNLKVDKVKSK